MQVYITMYFLLVGFCFISWLGQEGLERSQNELSRTILER